MPRRQQHQLPMMQQCVRIGCWCLAVQLSCLLHTCTFESPHTCTAVHATRGRHVTHHVGSRGVSSTGHSPLSCLVQSCATHTSYGGHCSSLCVTADNSSISWCFSTVGSNPTLSLCPSVSLWAPGCFSPLPLRCLVCRHATPRVRCPFVYRKPNSWCPQYFDGSTGAGRCTSRGPSTTGRSRSRCTGAATTSPTYTR